MANPEKAQLIELGSDLQPKTGGKTVTVQFNPESLKVAYSNQVEKPDKADDGKKKAKDQSGPAAQQFVGAGATKLSLQLWFDVTGELPQGKADETDVRRLTQDVVYFITPAKQGDQYMPPLVSFAWGTFQFDGIIDSLEETLEFFSPSGVPLRASVSLSMSQQRIQFSFRQPSPAAQAASGGAPPGTRPLTQASAGASLQGMAQNAGRGGDWRGIAEKNGVENPRLLRTGQMIDMDPGNPF